MAEPRVDLKLYLTDPNPEDPHYRAKWSVSSGSARYDLRQHERLLYEMVGEWAKTQMALYDERTMPGRALDVSKERESEGERQGELDRFDTIPGPRPQPTTTAERVCHVLEMLAMYVDDTSSVRELLRFADRSLSFHQ